jgi:pimeloyl-ACP methyl ester carboxylesterase
MIEWIMPRLAQICVVCLVMACAMGPALAHATAAKDRPVKPEPPQDTGFLNRKVELHGITYKFQVYLPEDWRRDDGKQWPIILFLHGRGERGSEGMWQTQIGIAEAVRNHPDRWPFVIVMPQCPDTAHWTDPAMLELAMDSLDQESAEFHGDTARTYLVALSMGGYGAWELGRLHPRRWAAIVIASSGVFWSYDPERWFESSVLPGEYASALGRTPIWLFHGSLDPVVTPKQSELMFDAFKASGGNIRLWVYQGLKHDSWSRAFDEPDLPLWLLSYRNTNPATLPAFAERLLIPITPPTIKLTPAQLDSLAGEYREPNGKAITTIYRQGEQLLEKAPGGEVTTLQADSTDSFFYPNGTNSSVTIHLTFEHDPQGRVTGYVMSDNRHEERWVKQGPIPGKQSRLDAPKPATKPHGA